MNRKTLVGALIALGILILLIIFCVWLGKKAWQTVSNKVDDIQNSQPAPTGKPNAPINSVEQAQRVYLAFGNPSNATQNQSNADNYLMVNNAYALSYNNRKGTANWVAWRISAADFGDAERQNNFVPIQICRQLLRVSRRPIIRTAVLTKDIYVRARIVRVVLTRTAKLFI